MKTDSDGAFPSASQLVADVSGLVSPPTVCLKLMELVRSSRASAEEIGDVVVLDPNLAARLLRIVNSSFYGFASQVDTIPRAVAILGVRDLCNLVLGISAVRSFSKVGSGLVRMETFWQHSIFSALLVRQLAKHYRQPSADSLFIAGLLHEIGACVIYSQLPDAARVMAPYAQAGEGALFEAERTHLGFTHANIGAMVLEQWQLPAKLQDAVCHHHNPDAARTGKVEAALVHLADVLANRSDIGAYAAQSASDTQVDESLWGILGAELEAADIERIVAEAGAQFTETMANLMPGNAR